MAAEHRDAGFLDPGVVDLLGDMGFEAPEPRVLGAVGRDRIEGPVAVILQADAAVEFTGEAADGDRSAAINALAPSLIGMDPLDLDTIERAIVPGYAYSPWADVLGAKRSFGAIELALWDIRGKVEGKPVATLLGGSPGRVRQVPDADGTAEGLLVAGGEALARVEAVPAPRAKAAKGLVAPPPPGLSEKELSTMPAMVCCWLL